MIAKAYIYYKGCHRDFENCFVIDNSFFTDKGFVVNVLQKVYCDYEDFFMVDVDLKGVQPVEEYFVFVISDDNVHAAVSIVGNAPIISKDCEEYVMKLSNIEQDIHINFKTRRTVLDTISSMFYRTLNNLFHNSNIDIKRNNIMLEQILIH